jgi:hypothetical protein
MVPDEVQKRCKVADLRQFWLQNGLRGAILNGNMTTKELRAKLTIVSEV